MRKPALTVATIVVFAAGATGCGATKYVTQTQTETQTQTTADASTTTVTHTKVRVVHAPAQTVTVTATASSTGAASGGGSGYASTYPSTFEDSFAAECAQTSGGNSSACACALNSIEHAVPYSSVIAANHDIVTGNPPSWYTNAITSCG